MTPDSVLKAMAEALAEKFTFTPEGAEERPLEERVNDGLAVKYSTNGYLGISMRPATCREAAVEAMNVVGPLLELVFRLKESLEALAKSHKEFIDEWARHDADAHTLEIQYVAESLIAEVEVREPADWPYLNQFSATPNEIHDILRSGLRPSVHLNYQQALARPILRQAAEMILERGREGFTKEELLFSPQSAALFEMVRRCADLINPDKSGPTLPREVVDPEG